MCQLSRGAPSRPREEACVDVDIPRTHITRRNFPESLWQRSRAEQHTAAKRVHTRNALLGFRMQEESNINPPRL